ncbi:hypothetical protein ACI2KC_06010 [Pseudomonas monteilii]
MPARAVAASPHASTLAYHWQTSACQGLLQASNDGKVSARGIASGPKALAYC